MAFGLAESLAAASAIATALVKGSDLEAWQKGAAGAAVRFLDKAAGGRLAKNKRLATLTKAASKAERWVATQPPSAARALLEAADPHRWPEVTGAIARLGSDLDASELRAAVADALALGAQRSTPAVRADAAELYVQAMLRVLVRTRDFGTLAGVLLAEARAARLTLQLDDVLARLDPARLPFSIGTLLAACHVQVERAVGAVDGRYTPELYVPRSAEGAILAALDAPRGHALGVAVVAPAGVGKTNLVCHLARTRVDRQPVVLLRADAVGDGPEALHRAIAFSLARAHPGVRIAEPADAVRALAEAAERLGRPALVLVDALDDHPQPGALRPALQHLLDDARHAPVRVLIACAEPTWRAVADASLRARLLKTPGEGDPPLGAFDAQELQRALDRYFDAYGVAGNLTPTTLERFRHPALLRLLCEVYEGREVGPGISLEVGPLFDTYWERTLDRAARRGWTGAPDGQAARQAALGDLLLDLATWLLDREARAIDPGALAQLRPWAGDPADGGSAVGVLCAQGVLARVPTPGEASPERVGFVFSELARYALGRALARRWQASGLSEVEIHAEVEAHIATAADVRTLAGALQYAGTRLWADAGLRLWPALLPHPGRWRRAGFAVLAQLDRDTLDGALDAALRRGLVADPEWAAPALDTLKTPAVAQVVPADLHQRAAGLLEGTPRGVRRRAALALQHAPADVAAPALAAALRDRRGEVRRNATTALFVQRAGGVAALREELRADDPSARADAAHALAALCRHPRASELWWALSVAGADLLGTLDDPDHDVRTHGLDALRAWIGTHDIEELPVSPAELRAALAARLEDRNRHVRAAAAAAIGALGPGPHRPLVDALADPVSEVAAAAATALASTRRPEAAPALHKLLSTGTSATARAAAAGSLAALAGPPSLRPLARALKDADAAVRAAAAAAMGPVLAAHPDSPEAGPAAAALARRLSGERAEAFAAALALADHVAGAGAREAPWAAAAFDVLAAALDRRRIRPRLDAIDRLGRARAADHRPRLEQALRAANADVRAAALEALAGIGDARSVPAIRRAAAAGRIPPDRAGEVLGDLERRAEAREELVPVSLLELQLADRDTETRAAAVEQLGRSTAPGALAAVERALSDRHPVVRAAAVSARAAQGGPRAGRSLVPALSDAASGVRRATAEALGGLATRPVPAGVSRALRQALEDRNPRVRAAAARAIAALGLADAADAMRALLRDADSEVRDAANSARRLLERADTDPDATTAPR